MTVTKRRKSPRKRAPVPFEQTKCGGCIALCCRYFALEVDRPDEPSDFEDLRWYMLHQNVEIFIEGRSWFVQMYNKCSALGDDNKCTIYETRPKICREYSDVSCDKDELEGNVPESSDITFRKVEELEAYRDKWVKRYEARMRRERREAAQRGAATRKRNAARKARKAREAAKLRLAKRPTRAGSRKTGGRKATTRNGRAATA
jgi:Fe-S-cluster containining protein